MFRKLAAVALLSTLAVPAVSHAGTIDLMAASGLTTPDVLVDFNAGLAPDTVVTTQFAGQGLTFSPSVRANSCDAGWPAYGVNWDNDEYLNTYGPGCVENTTDDSFSILFSNDVSAVSFNSFINGSVGSGMMVEALLNGVVQESLLHTTINWTGDNGGTAGIALFTDMVFDEIRFTELDFRNWVAIDNLGYVLANDNSVPAPGALALLGLGMLALAARRKRVD